MADPSPNVAVKPTLEEFLAAWDKAHPVNQALALAILRKDAARREAEAKRKADGGASCD
jgi:hypothetical protein